MIQAGTIRIGSGCTLSVIGQYWSNSISSLRNTTLPRDVATVLPITKSPLSAELLPPDSKRTQSLHQFCQPDTKLATPRTPVLASCHHCSPSRKACASKLNGGPSHSVPSNRRSCTCGLISDHGPRSGEK